MKTLYLILLAALSCFGSTQARNRFAIVTDTATYKRCQPAIQAYKHALEADGLNVVILSQAWTHPDEVRTALYKIRKKQARRHPLEGCVFIGDVPFVSLQNAQHLTTAFKMNEETFPRDDASVTTDRFYDCPDLRFIPAGRDTLNPLRFYYRLAEDSPQSLHPAFYSGRILYPSLLGGDKYSAISEYLQKVVRERLGDRDLDCMVTFAGHAYNSDCLQAWIDETTTLEEQFPQITALRRSTALTRLNFRMADYMKYELFRHLERPEVDLILFNEHGSPDKQHISGPGDPVNTAQRLEAFRQEVYYALHQERRNNGDLNALIAEIKETYHLSDAFFEPFLHPEAQNATATDTSAAADRDPNAILLSDLEKLSLQPRIVLLNACYNGSFHRPGYIAGYYLFNPGRTVVCQGNTVNVLQDRWTTEMIGLLSCGERVGRYNQLIATLEGHILGDPAFRFRNALTDPQAAPRQMLALRLMADSGQITADQLLESLRTAAYATVRMESLKLLSRFGYCPQLVAGVRLGLRDAYEPLRRYAGTLAGRMGAPELLQDIRELLKNDGESLRMAYTLENALGMYLGQGGASAIQEKCLATLKDTKASTAKRIQSVRTVRNYNYPAAAAVLCELVARETEAPALRLNAAEALGWYIYSIEKENIMKFLRRVDTPDTALAAEIRQTLLRLQ